MSEDFFSENSNRVERPLEFFSSDFFLRIPEAELFNYSKSTTLFCIFLAGYGRDREFAM